MMAKRRKPKTPLQPLPIWDDRDQPDEAWVPAFHLPPKKVYGWSDQVLICQFIPGDRRSTIMIASYDFTRGQWRTPVGEVECVTHWQVLPDFPKEHKI